MSGADAIDWSSVLGAELCGLSTDELGELTKASLGHAERAIRWDRTDRELPFEGQPVPWYEWGRLLPSEIRPGAYLHHAAGDYFVQDAGSMLALSACGVTPGEKVIDLCAAPGGKSTGLLEQLGGRGWLLANEVIGSRQAILRLTLARSGWSNWASSGRDPHQLADAIGDIADCVLVDAPCSGQSMVGRGKQSLSSFGEKHMEHCAARQARILEAATRMVKFGGRIVYSTCTYATVENESVIQWLLSRFPEWSIQPQAQLQAWESPLQKGSYRLWPHRDHSAGAYVCVLQRSGDSQEAELLRPNSREDRKRHEGVPPSKGRQGKGTSRKQRGNSSLPDWLSQEQIREFWPEDAYLISERHEQLQVLPRELSQRLPSDSGGFPVMDNHGRQPQPHYAFAKWLGRRLQSGGDELGTRVGQRKVTLTDDQAGQYVRGETIRLDAEQAGIVSGWCLVQWQDRVLAWGKLVDRTLKNHFPKGLRQTAAYSG